MMNKGIIQIVSSNLAKFGKALMVVIAVMPAAGSMISNRGINPIDQPEFISTFVITGGVLEQIGWAVIGNLHILFALLSVVAGPKSVLGVPLLVSSSLINRITGAV